MITCNQTLPNKGLQQTSLRSATEPQIVTQPAQRTLPPIIHT